MAVEQTGAVFKSLTFDGESSRDYGIYITGEAVFNAPEREVEMIAIPNRNGAFALDKGRFENIEVTYPAGVFADSETDFAKAISDFRNMLCSRKGYCRLTDEYNPDEFRLAVYKSGLEVDPVALRAGEFDITFECKPQRYLMSGEQRFVVGEWGDTDVKSGDIVTLNASDTTEVKSAEVSLEPIQDLHGYDKPWAGGNGKNLLPNSWVTTSNNGITFTANADGTVTANNTATANAQINIEIPSSLVGDYYFTINAGNDTNAFAYIWDTTANARAKQWDGTSACLNAEGDNNREVQLVSGHVNRFVLYVSSGKTLNNFVFRPMITAKTETNFTFEPYSNICPITGASDVEIYADGKYGGSINWNQLINPSGGSTNNCSKSYDSTTQKTLLTPSNYTNNACGLYYSSVLTVGHKYFATATVNPEKAVIIRLGSSSNADNTGTANANQDNVIRRIFTAASATAAVYARVQDAGWTNQKYTLFNVMFVDLTQCFGAGNEPSTVSEFTDLFYKDYYAYDAGTTTCVSAVNGDPYEHTTTSLGTTVYGGSVDVVAGSGQVTMAMVLLKNLSWGGSGSTYFYSSITGKETGNFNLISDAYDTTTSTSVTTMVNGEIKGHASNNAIYIKDDRYSTTSELISAMGDTQICYELATPVDFSLTPTEIELLQGINNVWSPQGEITLEYGQGPDFIVNPTLFGCGPLIETKGYGDIEFNGYKLSLEDGVIGDTLTLENESQEGEWGAAFTPVTLNTGGISQNGDTITVDSTVQINRKGASYVANLKGSVGTPPTTGTASFFPTSASLGYSDSRESLINIISTFTKGTSSTSSSGQVLYYIEFLNKQDQTLTSGGLTVTYTLAYNPTDDTITPSISIGGDTYDFTADYYSININSVYVDSSVTRLGDPTYIDCDLGEAYKIENGEHISLNKYIDLGSDLPEFAPGSNKIVHDNTFTEVAVTPRWYII